MKERQQVQIKDKTERIKIIMRGQKYAGKMQIAH
jgi:hypothetical protein